MDQDSAVPTNKVAAGGIAGVATLVIVAVVKAVTDTEVPAEVASAITVVVAFIASYFTREKASASTL